MGPAMVRTAAGAALAVFCAVGLAAPAHADPTGPGVDPVPSAAPADSSGSPAPDPTPTPTPTPTNQPLPSPSSTSLPVQPAPRPSLPATDQAPSDTPAQDGLNATALAQQLAAADQVWASLTSANAGLAAAMKQLSTLSAKVNALLEQISTAQETQAQAQSTAATARSELTVVRVRLENARAMSRLWAFQSYAGGGSTGELSGVFEIMGKDPSQAAGSASDLSFVYASRLNSAQQLSTLEAEQADLSARADQASAQAAQATATLEAAKTQLDPLLARQKAEVERLRTTQLQEIAKAGPVAAVLIGYQTPEAAAAAAKLRAALAAAQGAAAYTGGAACSNDDATYPNGTLPASALCPLWEAPGESLRPKAAAAFNAMSRDYAREFGAPICVSDSYRSLADQVAVKASRGKWAATPGTSHHGLGIAVDLCGGIESFGTSQHLWMQLNAPLYGFYHPSWAEPTGSLPEPWHWEYAG